MTASWAYQLPNFALAALMYTLLGRLALSLVFPPDSTNYIYRAFVRLTNPAIALARVLSPRIVPEPVLAVFAFIWLLMARIALLAAFVLSGAMQMGGAS